MQVLFGGADRREPDPVVKRVLSGRSLSSEISTGVQPNCNNWAEFGAPLLIYLLETQQSKKSLVARHGLEVCIARCLKCLSGRPSTTSNRYCEEPSANKSEQKIKTGFILYIYKNLLKDY